MTKRKILFRGKDINTSEWLYGDLVHSADGKRVAILVSDRESYNECEVKPDTVGQFTGLFDKTGKEIYEGDIICMDFNTRLSIEFISFKNGRFVTIDPARPYRDEALCVFVKDAAVIGNLHDTPSLLNEKER